MGGSAVEARDKPPISLLRSLAALNILSRSDADGSRCLLRLHQDTNGPGRAPIQYPYENTNQNDNRSSYRKRLQGALAGGPESPIDNHHAGNHRSDRSDVPRPYTPVYISLASKFRSVEGDTTREGRIRGHSSSRTLLAYLMHDVENACSKKAPADVCDQIVGEDDSPGTYRDHNGSGNVLFAAYRLLVRNMG